jgi:polysaccharide export outer membrane protein
MKNINRKRHARPAAIRGTHGKSIGDLIMQHKLFLTGFLSVGMLSVLGNSWSNSLAAAQETASIDPAQHDPQLKLSPTKVLQNFEPAANEEYAIGPGDEISLDFPGRPELGGKKIVGPDGRIDVADKTRSQVADAIVKALTPYYTALTVTVSIDKYGSNRIVIIGNVQHPGVLYFDTTPTLLDAIARGGLLPSGGSGAANGPPAVTDGIPDRCAIYRGNDQVVWVDLKSLLHSGNSMADLRLRRNDIVYVPAQQEVFVSVMGSVLHPGAIPLTPDSTLTSVLAQAGGLAEGAASEIQVIQPSTGVKATVSFKSLLTLKGTDEVKLHPGDVIYIPASGFYRSTYVLQRLSPIATVGVLATLVP